MSNRAKYSLFAVAALLLFGAGFLTSRATTPVEFKEKLIEKSTSIDVSQFASKADIKALMVQIATLSQKKDVHTVKSTTTHPDGTIEAKEETTDKTVTDSKVTTQIDWAAAFAQQFAKYREESKYTERTVERLVKTHSNYAVSLNVGYDFARIFNRGADFNIVPVRGLVGQLEVSKRLGQILWFEVWGNVWAQSTGVGGLGLKLQF